eukprot:scaffold42686_cov56-Phaeocystis_antarctica.AAC.4
MSDVGAGPWARRQGPAEVQSAQRGPEATCPGRAGQKRWNRQDGALTLLGPQRHNTCGAGLRGSQLWRGQDVKLSTRSAAAHSG